MSDTLIFKALIRLLTRREHSVYELEQKLVKYDTTEVHSAIAKCQDLGWQSDLRFAEMLCRTRISQGHGPLRIERDLKNARVDRVIIQQILDIEKENWAEYAHNVWNKKYKNTPAKSLNELKKQQQFLLSRGFYIETILHAISPIN